MNWDIFSKINYDVSQNYFERRRDFCPQTHLMKLFYYYELRKFA